MTLFRPARRRLTAAVTTVLAVTLGAGALTVSASAVPAVAGASAAGTASAAAAPIPYPADDRLAGVGVNGILTYSPKDKATTWRPYAGEPGWSSPGYFGLYSTRTQDYQVQEDKGQRVVRQRLAGAGGGFDRTVSIGDTPDGYVSYAGAAADAVFTTVRTSEGTVLRKHTWTGYTKNVTPVAGLPGYAFSVQVTQGTPGLAEIAFLGKDNERQWGLIDLAENTVEEIHDGLTGYGTGTTTHVAWSEQGAGDQPRVFVKKRADGTVREVPVAKGPLGGGSFLTAVLGDWVVYGQQEGLGTSLPSVHYPLTAYSLTTGKRVKLLDQADSLSYTPDGDLYATGGLVGRDQGAYRVSIAADGTPKTEQIATNGKRTELVLTDVAVPPNVLDLDRNKGFTFRWQASRGVEKATLTLRHLRTGKMQTFTSERDRDPAFAWTDGAWSTSSHSGSQQLHNGDYAWEVVVTPGNGIGPAAVRKGQLKIVRKAVPHDFNDNGTPDLLSRDSVGRLWRHDLYRGTVGEQPGIHPGEPAAVMGRGWGIYDRIEAAGNLGGAAHGDLLARDKAGVLWLYLGTGTGGVTERIRIGGGWGVYDRIVAGSDLTSDGRADALAVDKSGALWLYAGTGDYKRPFAARKRIGHGWGVYDDIATVGNIAGGPAGDLVARDKSGVLWQYLGKGDGTFAARTKVGGGWNTFTRVVGAGDVDGDGRPDLLGIRPGGAPALYKSTGDWKVPFRPAEKTHADLSTNGLGLVF
ncbi:MULTISPECIES: FG-GAP repeat domain-containing protein [unclassified Streptomyces]|uniref:FG-GAP repeat domain-containing protein n=1 Tax=unclassified Streptomyces TaxID=2593676 RepID=UPI001660D522|nr:MULTISPECIES: VCBS repeat-containing protein [unclassified Streptomyces]MBD0707210.1 hypothetical protein [Streptomyces sp. CBMA291]MBD0713698.1 hypothetical protein [Streptomyces sp. CBMA370]